MAASSKSMKSAKTSAKTSAARKKSLKDLPSVKADRIRGGAKTRVGDPGE
jgi:hypothetical protein